MRDLVQHAGSGTGRGGGGRASWGLRAAGLHRHLLADGPRHAAGLRFHHLPGHTAGLRHHLRDADLAAGGVRNFAGPDFRGHRAGGVRHLLGNALFGPGAGRIRHLLRDALFGPGAGCVGDPLRHGFTRHRAGGVRHALGDAFFRPGAGRVRHAFRGLARNLTADRVWNLAVTNFLFVAGTADGFHTGLRDPDFLAADGRRALFADHAAATGLVDRAATAAAEFPCARIADAFLHHRAGNRFGDSLPVARTDGNLLCFGDRSADGVADVFVAGLRFGPPCGAADFAITRLVAGLADGAADVAVARLIAGLADSAADIAVAGLVTGLLDLAADLAIARLVAGLAHRAGDIAVARLIAGLADGVAFIAPAGVVHGLRTADRNLFADAVHHRAAGGVGFRIPHDFCDGLIGRSAAGRRGAIIARRNAGLRRTAFVAGGSTITGLGRRAAGEREYAREDDHPGCVFHRTVPNPVRYGGEIHPVVKRQNLRLFQDRR